MTDRELWRGGTRLYDVEADARIEIQRIEGDFVRLRAIDDGGDLYEKGQSFRKQRYQIAQGIGKRYLYADDVGQNRGRN